MTPNLSIMSGIKVIPKSATAPSESCSGIRHKLMSRCELSLVARGAAVRSERLISTCQRVEANTLLQHSPVAGLQNNVAPGGASNGGICKLLVCVSKDLEGSPGLAPRHHFRPVNVDMGRKGGDPEYCVGYVLSGQGMGAFVK